ncbi:hypothetical protein RRG08_037869 [Elysia crispata]|uniref:Uncharacterized protein n=1 Tax=Elysia crispata TaxID=231223 RepID=A0AAE0ZK90_9GAST|nr:hypothetical protein RRG08_037869 [Elysia crispata]
MLDDLAEQEIKTDSFTLTPCYIDFHLIRVKQDVGRLGGTGSKKRQKFHTHSLPHRLPPYQGKTRCWTTWRNRK